MAAARVRDTHLLLLVAESCGPVLLLQRLVPSSRQHSRCWRHFGRWGPYDLHTGRAPLDHGPSSIPRPALDLLPIRHWRAKWQEREPQSQL